VLPVDLGQLDAKGDKAEALFCVPLVLFDARYAADVSIALLRVTVQVEHGLCNEQRER